MKVKVEKVRNETIEIHDWDLTLSMTHKQLEANPELFEKLRKFLLEGSLCRRKYFKIKCEKITYKFTFVDKRSRWL